MVAEPHGDGRVDMGVEFSPQEVIEFLGGRDEFRKFLGQKVHAAEVAKSLVEAALAGKGDAYSSSLQDTINRIGELLGFQVTYGEYRSGPDGIWLSSMDRALVVEVKTSTSFRISHEVLLGYMDQVKSERGVPKGSVLGLYVIGRQEDDTTQIEDSIRGGGRERELRMISAHELIALLELKEEAGLDHEQVLVFLPLDLVNLGPLIRQVRAMLLACARGEGAQPETPTLEEPSLPPKGKRRLVRLKDLLKRGIIEPGMEFHAKRKGKEYTTTVSANGKLILGKKEFETPSAAACAAAKTTAEDGWFFWHYRDAQTGQLAPIAELRAKLTGGLRNPYLPKGK
ncbi:MAG: hypothetical protein QHH25_04045 [Candidatus Acetothermia bacterium]|nr:hypothetical protein [Candidatus Acetothermia bacterium]